MVYGLCKEDFRGHGYNDTQSAIAKPTQQLYLTMLNVGNTYREGHPPFHPSNPASTSGLETKEVNL